MNTAVMIIHGLGGTSDEMQDIAKALQSIGLESHAITLPGHGGTIEEFGASRFATWFEYVHKEYLKLKEQGKEVIICGFSLGGILALKLAQREKVTGIVAIAAPVYLCSIYPYFTPDWRLFFADLIAKFKEIEYVTKRTKLAQKIAPWNGHDGTMYTGQLADFINNLKSVRKGLKKVTAPLLYMQDYKDEICHIYNANYIMNNVASDDVSLRLFRIKCEDAGHHLIVSHEQTRHIVAAEIASFIQKLINKQNLKH